MKKSRTYLRGILVLIALFLLGGGIAFLRVRHVLRSAHPLVLIHNPLNRDRITLGEGIITHATARSPNGVRRIELWVDGVLIDSRDSPEGEARTPLVLSSSWSPSIAGGHMLLVRAVSAEGVEGGFRVSASVMCLSQRAPRRRGLRASHQPLGHPGCLLRVTVGCRWTIGIVQRKPLQRVVHIGAVNRLPGFIFELLELLEGSLPGGAPVLVPGLLETDGSKIVKAPRQLAADGFGAG